MKFTLKDYQTDAVQEILERIKKATKRWHEDSDKHAFSLTAVTGAGKTVMAAAAFEALFHGDDSFDFNADPTAVVIWFSDDPALNEQTRFRLMEASDRLRHTDLVVVENSFNRAKFEANKIYFLNTQKLSKNSLLVRGFEDEDAGMFPETRPDLRSHTIWDTIRNTIEDPELTLYLVLDEAHRGMGRPSNASQNAKSTIVQRLINGANGVPGIPIVWGISATVERFNDAMEGAMGRSTLPNVIVDPVKVQESGLLKDIIVLDIPDEVGQFDTVLLRRATKKLKEFTLEWAEYAKQQGDPFTVKPLMVFQVPNTPDPIAIGRALDAIFSEWPEIPSNCIAHVFGEHTHQQFGEHIVPYISPEQVQDANWIQILLAKDAISTGWDCPRAEVMISFRAAIDRTHITQLLGRMVRAPLARRIPGNDKLNSVSCLLPHFDAKTVSEVADSLMSGGGDGSDSPPFGRVLINPKEMRPNPLVTDAIWNKFTSLPSQSRPQRGARPPKRLTALAHELASDDLLPNAGKQAHKAMWSVLDSLQIKNQQQIIEKRKAVLTLEGKTLTADLQEKHKSFDDFWEDADLAVIDDAYRRAARIITPDIAKSYSEYLALTNSTKEDSQDFEEAIIEARVKIAALGLIDNIQIYFDAEAEQLTQSWFDKYQSLIKNLTDDRQEIYRQIKGMSSEPQNIELVKPETRHELTAIREGDRIVQIPTYKYHILCDENGEYPAELNSWEKTVLSKEMKHPDFSFWYRNPQYPGQSSLGITYRENNLYKMIRPDFIFFKADKNGQISADIIDPHSLHLSDSLSKLQGLSQYAETHETIYQRIESIAEVNGILRVLDHTNKDVRKAVAAAKDAISLFSSSLAKNYT